MRQFGLMIGRLVTLLLGVNMVVDTNNLASSIGAALLAIFVLLLEVEV